MLHPLKSELNWPIGPKEPIDFSESSGQLDFGMRWLVPFHLLDAIFYANGLPMAASQSFQDSREALLVLGGIRTAILEAAEADRVQTTPHFVLLQRSFYFSKLQVLLARYVVFCFVLHWRCFCVCVDAVVHFLLLGVRLYAVQCTIPPSWHFGWD